VNGKWVRSDRRSLICQAAVDARTRKERQAEKQAVEAERRAIKKSARHHLKQQLFADLEEGD
jgi:hypothetical protein